MRLSSVLCSIRSRHGADCFLNPMTPTRATPEDNHDARTEVTHEQASRNPAEHCSRLNFPEWKATGKAKHRPF